ncbi:unnamed protein product [Taenia asiatica]|uniref:Secreted protein n=1 Tax=Taenia asiatica TaxID=60517 RepID=A0A0R3VUS8_TAEAS|nr:unnamed protein product [Taenia asiatica]
MLLFGGLRVPTHVSCNLILLIATYRYRSVRFTNVFATSAATWISSASGNGSYIAFNLLHSFTAFALRFQLLPTD